MLCSWLRRLLFQATLEPPSLLLGALLFQARWDHGHWSKIYGKDRSVRMRVCLRDHCISDLHYCWSVGMPIQPSDPTLPYSENIFMSKSRTWSGGKLLVLGCKLRVGGVQLSSCEISQGRNANSFVGGFPIHPAPKGTWTVAEDNCWLDSLFDKPSFLSLLKSRNPRLLEGTIFCRTLEFSAFMKQSFI